MRAEVSPPDPDVADARQYVRQVAQAARAAAGHVAQLSSTAKNDALREMANRLLTQTSFLREENAKDLAAAEQSGLPKAMVDRLTLTEKRIAAMAEGVQQVALLPDPVGEVIRMWRRPNGLQVGQMRVPLGVIGIIYEARPNVTADAASLCFKSGNACILRGGKEAFNSNQAIGAVLRSVLLERGLPIEAIQVFSTTDREAVSELLRQDACIDVIIPRGGKSLIRTVVEQSTIPVIKHYEGICHVYVDRDADLEMARRITMNAKVQRPGVCNAMETLLVHRDVAPVFLPTVCHDLVQAGVTLRGCEATRALVAGMAPATEEDWRTEYLDLILSIRVVDSLDQAMEHIRLYGSAHTDTIVTRDWTSAWRFIREVDSSSVMVNASTRFSDGFEYGLGAEIGISTDKLHARGPMGLESLTSTKFIVFGDGQVRE